VDDDRFSVGKSLERALVIANLPAKHEATITLARRYALMLDVDPASLPKIGPLMLSTLEALGLNRTATAVYTLPEEVPADGGATPGEASVTSLRDRARRRRQS